MRGKKKNLQTKPTVEVLTFTYEEMSSNEKLAKVVRGIEDLYSEILIQVKRNPNEEYYFRGWDYYTAIEIYKIEGDYLVVFYNPIISPKRHYREEELLYCVIRTSWGVAGKIVLSKNDRIEVMKEGEVEKLLKEYEQKEDCKITLR